MKVSAQEEYGLRCMLQLARRQAADRSAPLTLAEIAREEGLTISYVAKLIRHLRRAGLVTSVLGRSGGYALSREASRISIQEILTALGGRLFGGDYCDRHSGERSTCAHMDDCSIRSLWEMIGAQLEQVLGRTSIADLICSERSMCAVLDGRAPGAMATGGRSLR